MKKVLMFSFMVFLIAATVLPQSATPGNNLYLGQLMMVPFNFCPQGWLACNGQILPINSYTALFSLLGTTYGGKWYKTFALPDLRSRVPLGSGQGTGLSPYNLGQTEGAKPLH